MSTIENIKQMILEDSHRWQCPKYSGVVVVHPDQVKDVLNYINFTFDAELNMQRGEVKFDTGAMLKVVHMKARFYNGSGDIYRKPEHDFAGWQLTSVMFSSTFSGGVDGLPSLENLKGGGNINCMAYMMSRLRSPSEHPSKFVMM